MKGKTNVGWYPEEKAELRKSNNHMKRKEPGGGKEAGLSWKGPEKVAGRVQRRPLTLTQDGRGKGR